MNKQIMPMKETYYRLFVEHFDFLEDNKHSEIDGLIKDGLKPYFRILKKLYSFMDSEGIAYSRFQADIHQVDPRTIHRKMKGKGITPAEFISMLEATFLKLGIHQNGFKDLYLNSINLLERNTAISKSQFMQLPDEIAFFSVLILTMLVDFLSTVKNLKKRYNVKIENFGFLEMLLLLLLKVDIVGKLFEKKKKVYGLEVFAFNSLPRTNQRKLPLELIFNSFQKEYGWSQEILAEKLGLPDSSYVRKLQL